MRKQLRKKFGISLQTRNLASCTEITVAESLDQDLRSLLWRCCQRNALLEGKLIHCSILEKEHLPSGYINNLLLQMYGKCGALDDAISLFGRMDSRDVFSWSTIIDARLQNGQSAIAFEFFRRMQIENVIPSRFTLLSILPLCGQKCTEVVGKHIHTLILSCGVSLDAFLGTSLIHMYRKCENFTYAELVFNDINDLNRNVVVWTAFVTAYSQHSNSKQALQIFQQMLLECIIPDKIFFVIILGVCNGLDEAKYMHTYTCHNDFDSDVIIKNAIVNMYIGLAELDSACETFHDITQRTVVSWTTMISALTQNDLPEEALQYFQQMLLECVIPDNVTFVNVLAACMKLDSVLEGKRLHSSFVCSDFVLDLVVQNTFLHLYGKFGSLDDAQKMFDSMCKPDLISWNTLIAGYGQRGRLTESLYLFQLMCQGETKPDTVTYLNLLEGCTRQEALAEGIWVHQNFLDKGCKLDVVIATALIELYEKCGNLDASWNIFESIEERDVVIWTAMITACSNNNQNTKATQLFQQLQMECIMPNQVTFVSIILASANQVDHKEGKHVHARIVSCGMESDAIVGTALVDFYSKCGDVHEAGRFFNMLTVIDVYTWNAMMTAYAQHGDCNKALMVFHHMLQEDKFPDEVTLSVILCACSHAGLVDEAYQYFLFLPSLYPIKLLIDHTIRMVDLLGRAGQLNEAQCLTIKMPYQPLGTIWATILGACVSHCNMDLGADVARYAFELEPENVISYVALSNLYAGSSSTLCNMYYHDSPTSYENILQSVSENIQVEYSANAWINC